MSRIVIAGCGDVGTRLGLTLSAAGHEVWGLRRQPQRLPDPIRPLAADLRDPNTLGTLPEGIDALYYTAAAGGYREENYRAAYVDGELGLKGMYVGVPTVIGANGVEKVIDIKMTKDEQAMFDSSVNAVKGLVEACKGIDSSLS